MEISGCILNQLRFHTVLLERQIVSSFNLNSFIRSIESYEKVTFIFEKPTKTNHNLTY